MERVVLLIDMDCFYVQVDQKENPDTIGKPCAVVQYTSASAASLIAVSYEARARGVSRIMKGDAAQKQCPGLILFQIPSRRGKADLRRYRDAGAEVIRSISTFTSNIERASVDEAYIDVTSIITQLSMEYSEKELDLRTDRAHIVLDPLLFTDIAENINHSKSPNAPTLNLVPGEIKIFDRLNNGDKLKSALILAQKIKEKIFRDTSFQCSIGVGPNRMLAKIACSLNKPDKITVIPMESAQHLMNFTATKKVPGMGGKLGAHVARRFGVEYFGFLSKLPREVLVEEYGDKTGSWLYDLCRGFDHQAVSSRILVQSIACSKNFFGKASLTSSKDVRYWLLSLAGELVERIAVDRSANSRLPTNLTVHVHCATSMDDSTNRNGQSRSLGPHILSAIKARARSVSDSCPSPEEAVVVEKIADSALTAVQNLLGQTTEKAWDLPVVSLSLTAGKFRPDSKSSYGNVRQLLEVQAHAQKIESDEQTSLSGSQPPTPFFHRFMLNNGIPPSTVAHPSELSDLKRAKVFNLLKSEPFDNPSPPCKETALLVSPSYENESDNAKKPKSSLHSRPEPVEVHSLIHNKVLERRDLFQLVDPENSMLCMECGSRVLVHLMPEHTDFHVAQRIQRDWNKEIRLETQPNLRIQLKSDSKSQFPSHRTKKQRVKPSVAPTLDRFILKQ